METSAGITNILKLMGGIGTNTAWDNTHARIGVGDGNGTVPAVSASDTGLTATTNKLFQPVAATYPTQSGSALTYQAVFGTSSANFAWNEHAIDNGNASGPGTLLYHKGVALGTKTSGTTWTFTVTITQA